MGKLKNNRHEAFAQALAKGMTADKAYVHAGYKRHDGNAARMRGNERILARLAELQGKSAQRAAVTLESLADELDEARKIALLNNQANAAVSATMGKAKLFGLLVENKRITGPGGGPVQMVDLSKASDEQLDALESLFGPLAGAGGDNAGDQGGAGATATEG